MWVSKRTFIFLGLLDFSRQGQIKFLKLTNDFAFRAIGPH